MLKVSYDYIIQQDITDPTPYEEWEEEVEEGPHEVLEDWVCPICGKPFMSGKYAVCASLSKDIDNKFMKIFHRDCMTDEHMELLEKMGYDLVEDLAEDFE